MTEDIEQLIARNKVITEAEESGDLKSLESYLAPALAFRRRSGTVVDRAAFLGAANPGQRLISIESVQVFGNRALVVCTIDKSGERTHNVRLFIKIDGDWKVLGWANEPG